MMNGKEKLYFLLERIIDARDIAPSGQSLIIDPTNDLNNKFTDIELQQLFTKLQKDEQVLRVLQNPDGINRIKMVEDFDEYESYSDDNDGCWHIELLPSFDDYYLKIQQEPLYQEFTGKTPNLPNKRPLSRKSLEKIWTLLQEIEEKRGITSNEDDIAIPQVHYSKLKAMGQADAAADERLNILRKLENEDKAIKDVRWPHDPTQFVYLKVTDKYFDIYDYYETEYKKIASEYQESKIEENDIAYQIKYSDKNREILVNNFLLAKPDFNSENEIVFTYLYKNANRLVKTEELEQQLGNKPKKPIHSILRDLGFSNNLGKVFFNASVNGVMFRNPVSYQDLQELGVPKIKIQEKK